MRGLYAPFLLFSILLMGCDEALPPNETVAQATRASFGDWQLAPDFGCAIEEWILFCGDQNHEYYVSTVADLVASIPSSAHVSILYSSSRCRALVEDSLEHRAFKTADRVVWHQVTGPLTWWPRDEFLMARDPIGRPVYLLHHPEHYLALADRASLPRLPTLAGIMQFAEPRTRLTRGRVEGGAIVADQERAFVTPLYVDRAVQAGDFPDRHGVLQYMQELLGLPIVVLDVPDRRPVAHVDMFLAPAGSRRVVLGDPRLGGALLQASKPGEQQAFTRKVAALARLSLHHDDGQQFLTRGSLVDKLVKESTRPSLVQAFDAVETQLEGLGYEVVRIPWLGFESADPMRPLILAWTNVVQEQRPDGDRVYMPVYGLPALDDAAALVWGTGGAEVVRIEALGLAMRLGGLRCLTQTVRGSRSSKH